MSEENSQEAIFIRFSVLQRFLHIIVMVGFTGLAVTGFSLKFSSQWWAAGFVWLIGGAGHLAYLHRFFAVITYACVMVHILWLVYYKLVLKGSLTDPQSLFPRVKDIKDLFGHMRYFFGKGRLPSFNRFTYWEKFDYLAIFLGMNTMGFTGLILWAPEFFSRLIPGYFINLAQVLHLYEAILAVALKFVVHLISAHLRPEVFPMEKSIFTGRTDKEKLMREHPGEWEDIIAAPEAPSPGSASQIS
ncbi:MAG: cytochrome b/b6 domain-containing protein [Deltaproteobacteria bacterium]|nr:cytochrome b/b6 domain-containing protein [Deltaproteobacteria bacterium]